MKPPTYYRLNRADFVKTRYERYQKSLELTKELGSLVYQTDLDHVEPESGKQLKDVVICDCCNEDITDETIVGFENSRIYHEACAATYNGFNLKPQEPPVSYANVISLYLEDAYGEEE